MSPRAIRLYPLAILLLAPPLAAQDPGGARWRPSLGDPRPMLRGGLVVPTSLSPNPGITGTGYGAYVEVGGTRRIRSLGVEFGSSLRLLHVVPGRASVTSLVFGLGPLLRLAGTSSAPYVYGAVLLHATWYSGCSSNGVTNEGEPCRHGEFDGGTRFGGGVPIATVGRSRPLFLEGGVSWLVETMTAITLGLAFEW